MSKYRILVVDDDPDIRFVTKSLLSTDFETCEAVNGLDAIEKLERYEPDLVLLDIQMPVMNGFAACRTIRRQEQFNDMPVYFLTGDTNPATRDKAFDCGCEGFFEKPFETEKLIGEIREFFVRQRQPPRLKLFTPRELARIDATPLRAEADDEEEIESGNEPTVDLDASRLAPLRESSAGGRTRRVFGAAKTTRPEPPAPEPVAQPTAPPQAKPSAPRPPARPEPPPEPPIAPPPAVRESEVVRPAAPPVPKAEPAVPPSPAAPAPAHPDQPAAEAKPPATPAPRPRRPLPAAARTGSAAPAASRPRVLCLIGDPVELPCYTAALKGRAEFLPLEDPVEAIEIIARFQPDIIFARLHEAAYSGLQIGEMLRSNPRLAHIEMVFIATGRESPALLKAAGQRSQVPVLGIPLSEPRVVSALESIRKHPGFRVREKKLPYGRYVDEVLRKQRDRYEEVRKELEKEAYALKTASLVPAIQEALKEFRPSQLREIKDAQSYYLS